MRTMRAPDSEAKSLFINCKTKENSCFTHTRTKIKPVTAGIHTLKQSCKKMHEEHADFPQNLSLVGGGGVNAQSTRAVISGLDKSSINARAPLHKVL